MADTLHEAFTRRRSPLATAAESNLADMLTAPQPTAVVLVDTSTETAAAALKRLSAIALDTAPGQWLMISESDTPKALMTELAQRCGDTAAITDLSNARHRIRLHGPNARKVLQSGITIDLSEQAFPQGRSTPTAFRDVAVVVHASAEATFDLYVFRSYALTVWEWLVDVIEHTE